MRPEQQLLRSDVNDNVAEDETVFKTLSSDTQKSKPLNSQRGAKTQIRLHKTHQSTHP